MTRWPFASTGSQTSSQTREDDMNSRDVESAKSQPIEAMSDRWRGYTKGPDPWNDATRGDDRTEIRGREEVAGGPGRHGEPDGGEEEGLGCLTSEVQVI